VERVAGADGAGGEDTGAGERGEDPARVAGAPTGATDAVVVEGVR
jgi:hypothetical protein